MHKRTALAVIGAGFGDEGKGRVVDALASAATGPVVVVRSNGGAQAGHTVALIDGRRHVFHHFAAGALAGAYTHLSRFFVHHPMVFAAERRALQALGAEVEATADPRGLVTTPWDMLVNQAVERSRGEGRHGSCGLGFGETIERSLSPRFALTVADLAGPGLRRRCEAIQGAWTPDRLEALGVRPTADVREMLADPRILKVFLDDCVRFADQVALRPDATLGADAQVVFEGAQGLMLDQVIGVMPHVTRSHTGLVHMAAIAQEAGIDALDVAYVTRAYATRHGAGPLPGGADRLDGFDVVDLTNAPNAWQGGIRYAPLDLDRLGGAIGADLALAPASALTLRRSLVVTCLDQARAAAPLVEGGTILAVGPTEIAQRIGRRLGMPLLAEGWGAERAALRFADARCAAA